jgi:hypothetical protein
MSLLSGGIHLERGEGGIEQEQEDNDNCDGECPRPRYHDKNCKLCTMTGWQALRSGMFGSVASTPWYHFWNFRQKHIFFNHFQIGAPKEKGGGQNAKSLHNESN